jgi:hypothetical protein
MDIPGMDCILALHALEESRDHVTKLLIDTLYSF